MIVLRSANQIVVIFSHLRTLKTTYGSAELKTLAQKLLVTVGKVKKYSARPF